MKFTAGMTVQYADSVIQKLRNDAQAYGDGYNRRARADLADQRAAERWVVVKVWPPKSEHNYQLSGDVLELELLPTRTLRMFSGAHRWKEVT